MEAAKFRKLEEYAAFLGKKAGDEEREGAYAEAVPTYLKLVDVLLVMSDASPNYSYWVKCTTNAETYQKKIKSLLAKISKENNTTQAQTPST